MGYVLQNIIETGYKVSRYHVTRYFSTGYTITGLKIAGSVITLHAIAGYLPVDLFIIYYDQRLYRRYLKLKIMSI